MRKILLTAFILINASLMYAQVGINTNNPTATLDVISDNNTENYHILNAVNSDEKKLLSVNNNGDLYIEGEILPNNIKGKKDEYLVSQGENLPPIWKGIEKGNSLRIFNATFNNTSERVTMGTTIRLKFDEYDIQSDYGIWNPNAAEFTAQKKGSYQITVGLTALNLLRNNSPYENGVIGLFVRYLNSQETFSTNGVSFKEGDNYNYSSTISMSYLLDENDIR